MHNKAIDVLNLWMNLDVYVQKESGLTLHGNDAKSLARYWQGLATILAKILIRSTYGKMCTMAKVMGEKSC